MSHSTLKKSLLIIKAQATNLGAVRRLLRNREWKIKATTNLKEALMFLCRSNLSLSWSLSIIRIAR